MTEAEKKPVGEFAQKPEAPSPTPPKVDVTRDLSKEEIASRLRLVNPDLTKEVYDIAKAQVQSEAARHTRLDAKANSVITAAGLSMAVASSLGGIVASGKTELPGWLLAMFAFTGSIGLASVVFGVAALLVKGGYALVSDHAVFDERMLAFADAPTECDDLKDTKDKHAFGAAAYRQHMAAHLWAVASKDHQQLNRKAKQVRTGQWCFIGFLLMLFACELLMFRGLSSEHDAREAPSTGTAAPERAVRRQWVAPSSSTEVILGK